MRSARCVSSGRLEVGEGRRLLDVVSSGLGLADGENVVTVEASIRGGHVGGGEAGGVVHVVEGEGADQRHVSRDLNLEGDGLTSVGGEADRPLDIAAAGPA